MEESPESRTSGLWMSFISWRVFMDQEVVDHFGCNFTCEKCAGNASLPGFTIHYQDMNQSSVVTVSNRRRQMLGVNVQFQQTLALSLLQAANSYRYVYCCFMSATACCQIMRNWHISEFIRITSDDIPSSMLIRTLGTSLINIFIIQFGSLIDRKTMIWKKKDSKSETGTCYILTEISLLWNFCGTAIAIRIFYRQL